MFLTKVTQIFYTFGLIHPFLDGNGHIQRLIFSACIFERPDLELVSKWTIHPRPYEEEIALAYEQGPDTISRLKALRDVLAAYVKPKST